MSRQFEEFRAPVELDSEPYLDENPVWAEALNRQALLAAATFTTIEEAKEAVEKHINHLDAMGGDGNLFGKFATISSPRTYVPVIGLDILAGTYGINVAVNEVDEDAFFDLPTVEGYFSGFTHTLQAEMDDAEMGSIVNITPRLHAQVTVTDLMDLPVMFGKLCSHAAIGPNMTIEFLLDKQRRDASSALGRLAMVGDFDAQQLVHNLNTIVPIDGFDERAIRLAGRIVRMYLDRHADTVDLGYKDALLDFLKSRLRLYYDSSFSVKAIAGIKMLDKSSPPEFRAGINAVTTVEDVTLTPHFYRQGSVWTASAASHSPSVAIRYVDPESGDPEVLNIPFEKIGDLQPAV